MLIIGLDYHPSVQQIAFLDLESGEFGERQLNRNEGEVEEFYREIEAARNLCARGHGGYGKHMLVRAIHDGTWIRTLDWRPTPDSKATCTGLMKEF